MEPTVQPRTVADDDIPKLRDKPVDREQGSHTGSDKDISSNEDSNVFDRPFTESATAWDSTIDDGFLTDEESPNFEHMVQPRTVADNVNRIVRNRNNTREIFCEIPVTELVTVRVSDTEEPLVMRVSTITTELSELGTSACSETDISDIPVIKECVIPERRRPVKVSADADTQVVISDYQQSAKDYCFGVCEKTDRFDRSGIG